MNILWLILGLVALLFVIYVIRIRGIVIPARNNCYKADDYLRQGEFDKALELYFKALPIFEKSGE